VSTTAASKEDAMERIFRVASGIDVHRDTVVVTVRQQSAGKSRGEVVTRTFETFPDSLVEMTAWLSEQAVEIVGLESTGVYWKPVVRCIQEGFPATTVWLVNPTQVKKVPGRKTDVNDSQWLSKLVMYGLVSASYLASPAQDELRKLTRHRTKLKADRTRYANRLMKELEASGIKLGTVCSNVLGKSGRAMLEAILEREKTGRRSRI
jgi:transposase